MQICKQAGLQDAKAASCAENSHNAAQGRLCLRISPSWSGCRREKREIPRGVGQVILRAERQTSLPKYQTKVHASLRVPNHRYPDNSPEAHGNLGRSFEGEFFLSFLLYHARSRDRASDSPSSRRSLGPYTRMPGSPDYTTVKSQDITKTLKGTVTSGPTLFGWYATGANERTRLHGSACLPVSWVCSQLKSHRAQEVDTRSPLKSWL